MSNYADQAESLFLQGYNCAQATAAAFAERQGIEQPSVLRAMAGFGGGFAGLRETCGAVSAMAYVAGLHHGAYAPGDLAAKQRLYRLVREMVGQFRDQYGTSCCKELLQRAACETAADPSERTPEYYARRPCVRFVRAAAGIIERALDAPPVSPLASF